MVYQYKYPRPSVSVDLVVLANRSESAEILLIQRKHEPFKNHWALPGGFMNIDETLEQAAIRELREETGVSVSEVRQVGTFSSVDRDPRGRVVTTAFLIELDQAIPLIAGDDAKEAEWFRIDRLPPLAFDHEQIIDQALRVRVDGWF